LFIGEAVVIVVCMTQEYSIGPVEVVWPTGTFSTN